MELSVNQFTLRSFSSKSVMRQMKSRIAFKAAHVLFILILKGAQTYG